MSARANDINTKILIERINQLYKRSNLAIISLLLAATTYFILLLPRYLFFSFPTAWYACILIILFIRFLHARKYTSMPEEKRSPVFWLQTYRLIVVITGIAFGSVNILFFPHDSLPYLMISILFPLGILVGAVAMLLDHPSFVIYAVTLMLPISYQMARLDNHEYQGTALIVLILMLFCIQMSKKYNDNFMASLRLSLENKALLQRLEKDKNKLNNRLGRLLNDSSNEIFIIDAESFLCLQVNRGVLENLGYNADELSSMSILEIFTNLDEDLLQKLIAPLNNGSKEFVMYQGENRRKDGSLYPVEARIQLSNEDTPPIIIITVQNVTERAEWKEKLIYQANFDLLTGLPNRNYIQSVISIAFTRAQRRHNKLAILFLDLDNFKSINDTLGHRIGDEVLKLTAERIRHLIRKSDVPARTGGDEFTILLEGLDDPQSAGIIAEKLVKAFQKPFVVEGRELVSTLSIGISIFPDDGDSLDPLMQYADMAMYQAKESGRNKYCFFSRNMRQDADRQMCIISQLRNALAKDELHLYYQPKIDIRNGAITGAEALLRWDSPELGSIPPEEFIHLAESMGFIENIGSWVLEEACKEAMYWQTELGKTLQVSVNVSPQQFRNGSVVQTVDQAISKSGLPHELLELEITESLLLQDSDQPYDILQRLAEKGVNLSLDDFGTGYSSLSYLKRFPLQVLKIDRSFIHDLQQDQHSRALVEAIIAMAQSMKLGIVAEGIENEEQIAILAAKKVGLMQGFFFSPPVAPKEFHKILLQETPPTSWTTATLSTPDPEAIA